jgi:uncharacterized membrane protein
MSANEPQRQAARRLTIWTLRFARNWFRILTIVLAVWVALPFIAPTLMHVGAEGPANLIYRIYSPFCHQFGFRSFYLFGDQSIYPREAAGMASDSYEVYTADVPELAEFTPADEFSSVAWTFAHKNFVGNEAMGYKVTLCQRDIAIYAALFIGALIYNLPVVRRRLRPAPLYLYVILGVTPIGIDGFSQLLSYPPFEWWPVRETWPVYRVLTGALFGLMSGWLGLPYIEQSMRETRREIEAKLTRAGLPVPKQS